MYMTLSDNLRRLSVSFSVGILYLLTVHPWSAIAQQHEASLTSYVDPYIGVDWGGNTFVGSAVPFGMVKLGPDMETFDHRPSGFGYSSDGLIRI
jgi:putative alpha-1,2-mannosidase